MIRVSASRLIVMTAAFAMALGSARADSVAHDLNIESGSLSEVLRRLADQVNLQMVFYARDAQALKVGPLRGRYTPEQALDVLLKGSDLEYQYVDARTISVRKKLPAAGKANASAQLTRAASATHLSLVQEETAPKTRAREENNEKAGVEETAATNKAEEGETEVLVTGSRIRSLLGESDFTPVLTLTRDDIERAGLTSIGELSRLIPQAYSTSAYEGMGFGGQTVGTGPTSDGSTTSAVATSRSTINLRGLGTENTLILVDGRRLPTSGVSRDNDGNDLAGIPIASVERVEVLTDGASAVYGSDAVAGVVNIILRKDYNGTEANATYENTFDTDTAVNTYSLSHSHNGGKLSFSVAGSFQTRNAFAARDRYFSANDDWAALGAVSPTLALFNSFSSGVNPIGAGIVESADGSDLPGLDSNYAIIPDGATGNNPASDYVAVQGNFFGVPSRTDNRAMYTNLISPQRNRGASARVAYDFSPGLQWFADARYTDTRTDYEGFPVNYRNYLFVPADYPGNPFDVDVYVSKAFWELGNIQGAKTARTASLAGATGLSGGFGRDWRYETSLDWGRSVLRDSNATDPILFGALYEDAIANEELVLFYDSRTVQPNDPELLLSFLQPADTLDRNTNLTLAGSANGPVFTLPSGRVRIAFGAEHRRESANTRASVPDPDFINLTLLGDFDRDVSSAYTELLVPVIAPSQDIPLVHRLDATAAIRYDHYSDIGGDYSPRFGLQWRPFSWMLLRATRNEAFRAPGLQALYRPLTYTEGTATPFDEIYDPARDDFVVGLVQFTLGGNLGLRPERSTSTNLGVVLESPFSVLEGLSLSADFLELDYRDRISPFVPLQTIIDLFPERLTRGAPLPGDPPGMPGPITGVDTRVVNIARNVIRSVDYQLKYNRSTSFGTFDVRGAATVYDRNVSRALPGAPLTDTGHLYPTRYSWQGYWNRGPLGLGVSGFMQEHRFSSAARTAIRYAFAVEWNAHLFYTFGHDFGSGWSSHLLSDTRLALTVFNVADREPPHPFGRAGFGITDPRMRRYTLSWTRNF